MGPQRTRFLALGAVAGLLLYGCGGGASKTRVTSKAGVTATEYAALMCGAVFEWVLSLKDRSETLESEQVSVQTPEGGRTLLVNYLDITLQETDSMVAKVRALDPPDVDQGEEFHGQLIQSLERMRSAILRAEQRAKELPIDDRTAFAQEAEQIGTSAQSEMSSFSDWFDIARSPELDRALGGNLACRKVAGS